MDIDFSNPSFVPPPKSRALTPQDQNWVSPSGFLLAIHRNKPLEFNCQKIEIPDVNVDVSTFPTPLIPISFGGHPVTFGELYIEFKIDSGFKNWWEIYKWIRSIGFLTNEEYAYLESQSAVSDKQLYSDISVIMLDNLNNPEYKFTFTHAFPISLGRFSMESSVSDINYLNSSVTFKFLDMQFEPAT